MNDEVKKKRWHHLEALWEITRMLHTSLNLKEVLDMALTQAMKAVHAEAGTLWLNDNQTNEFIQPVLARGPKADGLKGLKLKIGEGMAGWVTESGQSQMVSDVLSDPRWSQRFDQSTGFITRSLLCVPLLTQTSCIGCLQLVNKLDGQLFDGDDLNLCEALAGVIGMAVENSRLYTDLKTMFKSFLVALASAIDARDPYTRGHSERVSQYSLMMGKALGLPEQDLELLERAAFLHDIGKIGIRDHILLKESPLDNDEFKIMKTHTTIGQDILQRIEPNHLVREIALGAACHHERYDGKGYPQGLKGEEIPLPARIMALADTFDAMITDRPYRKGLPVELALQEIKRCADSQFDPQLAEIFLAQMKKE